MEKDKDVFKVSVILPVYNAERYVVRAIQSAINQPYVGEIIVVDDGYPDAALEKCQALKKAYSQITILKHPNGENRGAGASRNLGLQHAKYDYVSFLDADDYYLENRFSYTKDIFEKHQDASVVYEPVGTAFESEEAKMLFCSWRKISETEADRYVTNLKGGHSKKSFLVELLKGRKGAPQTNGITIKKELLNKVRPWFKENLRLHQDSEFWSRLAYYGNFYPSASPSPVAMRWVHLENRIAGRNYDSAYLKEKELFDWAKSACKDKEVLRLIAKRYIFTKTQRSFQTSNKFVLFWSKIRYLLFIKTNPLFLR